MQSTRSYLNGLVQATAAGKGNQVSNVAFVKTHKTASTTLAAIMYRYAVRHDLKTKQSRQLVDIMHYHITPKGQYRGTWDEAAKYYRGIMRHPDRINFVTVLREPRSHLLSYYYYYIQPRNQLSIEEFFMNAQDPHDKDHELLVNPLSAEFGVRTAKGMETLIQNTLPDFKLRLAPYANSIQGDKAQFEELQNVITNYLDGNSSSLANPMYRSMNVYQEPPLEKYPF
eukprot:g7138.t1